MSIFSNVYFSRLSFTRLDTETIFLDFLESLKIIAKTYDKSSIKFEIASDFYDYSEENLSSLADILLHFSGEDSSKFGFFLSEFEKVYTPAKSYENTFSMKERIINWDCASLPTYYPFVVDEHSRWSNLENNIHTHSYENTQILNCNYIVDNHLDLDGFVNLFEMFFNFLIFHKDILSSLKTIKKGDYRDYIHNLLHCMNVLNQAYNLISTDPTKNQEDLDQIMILTGKLGHRLECSRQGKNKVEKEFDFPEELNIPGSEVINCEYHLKIDHYDNGQPIERGLGNKVRVYFSLKSYQGLSRKKIQIAHMGMHL
ncbi:hypothetical protein PY247_16050 [Acinetobacter proteolyticus]|nr:hypothetical protein [Acinetobacter proteolyticus]WEI17851.1 hypothetical protein PY247_16050 [Acinetobacter proteolyticus]